MIDRSLRLELAAALRVTEAAAGDLIGRAVALAERYPAALDALRSAAITEQHVRILVDRLDELHPEVAERLTVRAVGLASEHPVGVFRRTLRDLLETEGAATLSERHEDAVHGRRVWVDPADDGMAWLVAYLPAVEAHAVFDRLTRMGKTIVGRTATADDGVGAGDAGVGGQTADARTLDQVRADVLCDLLIDGACAGHPTATRGIRPTVVVTVPALSLLDDAHAGIDPARIEGVGPIPIARARALCAAAPSWMRVLTHPETGIVLSVGRDRYDPPPELRRLVRWRAERCMAPGCAHPASRCEIDHTLAWVDGGNTAADNLNPLCSGHHHVKHAGGWSVTQPADGGGAMEWTSPYGRRYLVVPERRSPVFAPVPKREHVAAPF